MCSAAPAIPQVLAPLSTGAASCDRGLTLIAFVAGRHLAEERRLPEDPAAATREVLSALPLELLGDRCRLQDPVVRRSVPPRVVEAWRFFTGTLALLDDVKVAVSDVPVSSEHQPVWVVFTAVGPMGGFLEVYDARGAPLCSARRVGRGEVRWDDAFGASRAKARGLARRGEKQF
ncbi:MAG: hypothetical protein ACO3JL_01805 [Myxococcota bacterium]